MRFRTKEELRSDRPKQAPVNARNPLLFGRPPLGKRAGVGSPAWPDSFGFKVPYLWGPTFCGLMDSKLVEPFPASCGGLELILTPNEVWRLQLGPVRAAAIQKAGRLALYSNVLEDPGVISTEGGMRPMLNDGRSSLS